MDHGVNVNELATAAVSPVRVSSSLPVYTGTAKVNEGDPTFVNKPAVFYTLDEYVAKCGHLSDSSAWGDWTLDEAAHAHFSVYGVGPIVCINVIDPTDTDHTNSVTGEAHVLDADGQATIQIYGAPTPLVGVLKSSVVVKVSGARKTLGTDYTLAFDDDGYLVVTRVTTGTISAGATITVDYTYLDPTGVTSTSIIGGYSGGVYTGLEVVKQVYPQLRLVPCLLLAPKWSEEPTVAARMKNLGRSINAAFKAMALCDLSTDPVDIASYSDAPAWKLANGYTGVGEAACWPLAKNGSDVYHLSTVLACVIGTTDAAHDGIPYASPSNKAMTATAMVLDDATTVYLDSEQANALNAQGIVTGLNGYAGWSVWGNRTAGYPATTDPKDAFIPQRRMGDFINNTLILTIAQFVDEPGNKRLLENVANTVQYWINSLIAKGAMLAGSKCEFRVEDNPAADLLDGKYTFTITQATPIPAENIVFKVVYDPALLAGLFA